MKEFRTFYVRDAKQNPMACVVYLARDGEVEFSISIRNLEDKLDKKLGRAIALQRFLNGKTIKLGYCNKICSPKYQVMRFLSDAHVHRNNFNVIYPKRIVSGAGSWLAANPRTAIINS